MRTCSAWPTIPSASCTELPGRVSAVSTCFALTYCQVSGITRGDALHLEIQQERAISTCSTLAPILLMRGHRGLQPVSAACAGHPIHPVALQTLWTRGVKAEDTLAEFFVECGKAALVSLTDC